MIRIRNEFKNVFEKIFTCAYIEVEPLISIPKYVIPSYLFDLALG